MRYVRHVAVYKAMRNTGVTDRDPIALGERWPADLFELVKKKAGALQREYNSLLKKAGLEMPAEQGSVDVE